MLHSLTVDFPFLGVTFVDSWLSLFGVTFVESWLSLFGCYIRWQLTFPFWVLHSLTVNFPFLGVTFIDSLLSLFGCYIRWQLTFPFWVLHSLTVHFPFLGVTFVDSSLSLFGCYIRWQLTFPFWVLHSLTVNFPFLGVTFVDKAHGFDADILQCLCNSVFLLHDTCENRTRSPVASCCNFKFHVPVICNVLSIKCGTLLNRCAASVCGMCWVCHVCTHSTYVQFVDLSATDSDSLCYLFLMRNQQTLTHTLALVHNTSTGDNTLWQIHWIDPLITAICETCVIALFLHTMITEADLSELQWPDTCQCNYRCTTNYTEVLLIIQPYKLHSSHLNYTAVALMVTGQLPGTTQAMATVMAI